MSERFEQVRDEIYYHPNGTMRESKKVEFLKNGVSADEIARMEERAKERIFARTVYRGSRLVSSSLRDRRIERTGLSHEEALTECFQSVDGLDSDG